MKTYDKIYKLVKKIPKGKVTTYRQIGQILNLDPRIVGWALNKLANIKQVTSGAIPWQRVINSKGGISTDRVINIPLGLQKRLLEKEGIKFQRNGKINLKKYFWKVISVL